MSPDTKPSTDTTPASPGDSSSTTSWPATEIAQSEAGDSATATPSSPVDSLSRHDRPTAENDDAARSLEGSSEEDAAAPPEADKETPVSPTWSRTKLPVSDDERDAGAAVSPAAVEDAPPEGAVSAQVTDKPTPEMDDQGDAPTPTKATPGRPAFVVTRPTTMGENEVVSVTQPSTPSASVHEDEDGPEPAHSAKDSPKPNEVALQPASNDSLKPSIQITTFLPETKAFFASPTSTNLPSAISPRTSAFFSSDFSVSGPRSPPRPGGAFIMELSSDVDVDIEVDIRRATRTTVSTDKAAARVPPTLPPRPSPAASTKHRSRSPSPEPKHREQRDKSSSKSRSRSSRSRQRQRQAVPLHGNHSDTESGSDLDAQRGPFLPGRTVVSSAAPFLNRTESLRQQAHRQARDGPREEGLRSHAEEPRRAAHDDETPSSRPRGDRQHRPRADREERRREDRSAERERVTSRREHVRDDYRRTDDRRLSHDHDSASRRRDHDGGPSRRDEPPARDERKPALARLLDAVQQALEHDPAAYYALKGLLAEHKDRKRRGGGGGARDGAGRRAREEDERHVSSRREERGGSDGRDERRLYERERREKRIPVDLMQAGRSSESDTEVDAGKVKRGGALKTGHFDVSSTHKLRKPHFSAVDPPRRDSPAPPSYPSHLSPQRPSPSPDVVRPVPLYPRDGPPPSHRVPHPHTLPRPAETLTLAQAAKLASGLGDPRLAAELRASGLSGRDKVSQLDGRGREPAEDAGEGRRADGEREGWERERSGGKGKSSSRRDKVDGVLKLERRAEEKVSSASSSKQAAAAAPSAKDALLRSIFEVRVPAEERTRPETDTHKSHKHKNREDTYSSPLTGSASRSTRGVDRDVARSSKRDDDERRGGGESRRGGALSFDFDDFA